MVKILPSPTGSAAEDMIVISWDTAMKSTELADYSVGTVWHVQGNKFFLLDLIRGHYDYPELKRAVLMRKIVGQAAICWLKIKDQAPA